MLGKIDEVAKEIEKILTKKLLDNKYEVNQQGDSNMKAEQKMDDTSIPNVYTIEPEEVRVEYAVDKGGEDARKADEDKDKSDNPLVLGKEVDTEKDAKKEHVEVKVEVEAEARHIEKSVKGKQTLVEDP